MSNGEVLGTPLDYVIILLYFVVITGFGAWFGRYTKTTGDFFFGGQRFAWWLIAFSCVATTVGSYSFVKYSAAGFTHGISSTQSYLNDWYWMPIVICVWLPIIYYMGIQSVPEYFERRFGTVARLAATALILVYLVGYVGINLYTIGTALNTLLGWHVMAGAGVTAIIVMIYVLSGGQTSVIMTDLAQGLILLVAGLGVFFVGIVHLGGFADFWALLPEGHRYAFSRFNEPANFSAIGIWGQDGLANSGAFMLMNQGIIMRFLSMRSVSDARKMAVCWTLVLMPLAAVTVSGGGWIARAMVEQGGFATNANDSFIAAAHVLLMPGVFGFVLAAMTAALMSTADTLINASTAIFINDIYRPYLKPGKQDRHYLSVARVTSFVVVTIGILLVLVFMREKSIYSAHGMFTAAVTPPIVVAILFGILWKGYTPAAAVATIVGGGALIALSLRAPFDGWFLEPLSFGMGPDSYKFIRALFGLICCSGIGVGVSLFTTPRKLDDIRGLVTGTQLDAMRTFKGGEPNRTPSRYMPASIAITSDVDQGIASLSPAFAESISANDGDIVYVCDARWWFGGLRSVHARARIDATATDAVRMHPDDAIAAHFDEGVAIKVNRLL